MAGTNRSRHSGKSTPKRGLGRKHGCSKREKSKSRPFLRNPAHAHLLGLPPLSFGTFFEFRASSLKFHLSVSPLWLPSPPLCLDPLPVGRRKRASPSASKSQVPA